MEFYEKLQLLRKQHNLTQEQLANQLFVSRTAVSKWESGRGYPSLDSLKSISRLFSVSIDELLSNHELIRLAQAENHLNIRKISCLVFGVLDLISIVLLWIPLFGLQGENHVMAVSLWSHTKISVLLHTLYSVSLSALSLFGLWEIISACFGYEKAVRICKPCSVSLSAAVILLFAISRQPYMTALLFFLFLVKVALLLQENRMK